MYLSGSLVAALLIPTPQKRVKETSSTGLLSRECIAHSGVRLSMSVILRLSPCLQVNLM